MKTNILFLSLMLIIISSRWSWAEGEKIIPSSDSELAVTKEAEWSGFLNKNEDKKVLWKRMQDEQNRSSELTDRYEKLLEKNEAQAERYEQILSNWEGWQKQNLELLTHYKKLLERNEQQTEQYKRILNKWEELQKAMDKIIAYWQGDIGEQE